MAQDTVKTSRMRRVLSLNASSLWHLRTGMAMKTVEVPHAPPSSLEVIVYGTRFGRYKVFERTRDGNQILLSMYIL